MNIFQAVQSGKPFRRISWKSKNWIAHDCADFSVSLTKDDVISTDWEIHPSVTTITKDEFFDAWERTKNMKVLGPILENSVLYRDALAKELGL